MFHKSNAALASIAKSRIFHTLVTNLLQFPKMYYSYQNRVKRVWCNIQLKMHHTYANKTEPRGIENYTQIFYKLITRKLQILKLIHKDGNRKKRVSCYTYITLSKISQTTKFCKEYA